MNMEKNLARRAEISRVDSPGKVQVQALGGQALEAARFQPWGFASQPSAGTQGVVVFVGASAPGVLDESTKGAPALASAEVKIYAKGGASVHLKANGDVLVTPGSGGRVELGGEGLPPTAGVVTGACVCAFTGAPHPQASPAQPRNPPQGCWLKRRGDGELFTRLYHRLRLRPCGCCLVCKQKDFFKISPHPKTKLYGETHALKRPSLGILN